MLSIQELYQIVVNASGITTDTRNIKKGDVFFALKGENFDGNKYAESALESGASFAVIDDVRLKNEKQMIYVEDVLTSLQSLANFHRRQFDIPILAITGSNGKTTTKELIAGILSTHYKTHFTKGNLNNHIGVPLTLLGMPLDTEIAVIEMGANHIGEIAFLCDIIEPTHGLITNVGKAHLEGFGSFEGVKKAKSELYDFLAENNKVALINLDEPFLKELGEKVTHKVFYHESEKPNPQVSYLETKMVASEPTIMVAFLSDQRDFLVEATTNLFGLYNFNNVQTAITIGRYFKVPALKIKDALEGYVSTNNRSQLLKKESNTIILDAYNANPTSMRIAIDNLTSMSAPSKIAILGDMLELGEYSKDEHLSICHHALDQSFTQLIFVGNEFESVIKNKSGVLHFSNVEDLKVWFDEQHFNNALILLKGSRGIRLEKLFSN